MPDYFPGFPCNIYETDFDLPLASNQASQWHWHERLQLMRIEKGSIELSVPNHKATFKEGMIIVIPPRLPHQIISSNQGKYTGINFDLSMVAPYHSAYYQKIILPWLNHQSSHHLLIEPSLSIYPLFSNLFDTIIELDQTIELTDQPKIFNLLFSVIPSLLSLSSDNGSNHTSYHYHYLYQIFDYIESNLAHPFSLNDIASAIGLSPSHLSRYFYHCCSIHLFDYINNRRIERSVNLLQDPSRTIQSIAFDCGFTSASYFIATFKQKMKQTPHQFRKNQFKQ